MVNMWIKNLLHRGACYEDICAEIVYREENGTPSDDKTFGYTLEELKQVKENWWNT